MGSLLPGWDERAPGVPPKEMEDYRDSEDEEEGYFARLEKQRSLRHQLEGSPTALQHSNSVNLARRSLERPGSLKILRRASLPADFRLEDPLASSPLSPSASPFAASPPGRGGGGTIGSRLDAYRAARKKDAHAKYSWWDKMGSSMLNEKPDEPEDHGHGYVPQYDVTGQGLRYRMSLEGSVLEEEVEVVQVQVPPEPEGQGAPAP